MPPFSVGLIESHMQAPYSMTDNFSLNTYSYTLSVGALECIRHLAGLGARQFELMLYPGHLWVDSAPSDVADIRRFMQSEGLSFTSTNTVNVDLNIAGASAEMRRHSLSLVERFIRLTGELGAPAFILGPGKPNPLLAAPFEQMRDYFLHALDRLVPVARQSNVELWVENMPFSFLPDLDGILNVLDAYGEPAIGICYDVANAHFIGEDPAQGIRRLGNRMKLMHISDTTRQTYLHAAIGAGDIDFAAVGRAVGEMGLERNPVLEIISPSPDRDLFSAPAQLAARGYQGHRIS